MRGHLPLARAAPVALLAAGACAPSLHVRAPDLATPPAFEAPAGAVAASAIPLDRWWESFGDPQLDALVGEALANGTDARLALARLEEARAIRSAALARFRVQGDLQANASAQRQTTLSGDASLSAGGATGGTGGAATGGTAGGFPAAALTGGDTNTASANLNLSWEADLFGRRAATRRGAEADLAAARFAFEGARATLAADVADALFAARGLQVQLADARETARIQRDLRGVLAERAARGVSAESDVARIDTDLAQTEAQAAQFDAELVAAKRALLVLTGASAARTADLPITGAVADAPQPPATLPGDLLRRRPDVREAEERFRSAVATAEVRRLDLFPRLTLTPGVGLTTTSGTFAYSVVTWTLGAGLALPLLDRPRLLAELRAQTARADQTAITYERTVQTAFSEADQALVRLAADRCRVDFLAAGERRAAFAHDAARTLFARGFSDLQALLDAERTWRASRQALAAARVDALRRAVTSFRALGGGWSPEPSTHAAGSRP